MGALSRWIHPIVPARVTVDARDADQLRADWGISYLELRGLPPGPERDAMVKRCVELAKAFERSFRR